MRVWLSVTLLPILTMLTHAQTTAPTTTYTIHTQPLPKNQLGWTYTVWAPKPKYRLTPNGSLILLLPQADKQWALKKITAWDTSTPKEETLNFAGDMPERNKNVLVDFRLTPDGRYVLLRLKTIPLKQGSVDSSKIESTVVVVDLRSFSIRAQIVTSDTLLNANWRFTENGLLLATASTGSSNPIAIYSAHTSTHLAAIIQIPELVASPPCTFTTDTTYSPGAKRPAHTVHDSSVGCTALLNATQVATMEDIAFSKSSVNNATIDGSAPPHCTFWEESIDKKFVLYECGIVHNPNSADGFLTYETSRSYKVVSVEDSQVVLTLPFSWLKGPSGGMFAKANGHDYLLHLKDGLTLDVYRLP